MSQEVTKDPDEEGALAITGIHWQTTIFLIATTLIAAVASPLYALEWGVGWVEVTLFLVMTGITGLSITSGYHRLFTHRTYSAYWPVRLAAALGGAAAFQMSALAWSSEHRFHHKYTDQEGDPHDPHSIRRGFVWAHVGWLICRVRPKLVYTNVEDLRRDPIVVWQDRFYVWVAIATGFLVPMAAGVLLGAVAGYSWWQGLAAGSVFGACLRIVVVHHLTFFINSLAHTMGRRPYDGTSSSRDSGLLAFLTFGEGYHNYHHAFQTDYRNGVRAWHFDPAKWLIWTLSKLGLAYNLRRIPEETIRLARLREKRRRLESRLASSGSQLSDSLEAWMQELEGNLDELHLRCRILLSESVKLANHRMSEKRQRFEEVRRELRQVRREFRRHWQAWKLAHRQALTLVPA